MNYTELSELMTFKERFNYLKLKPRGESDVVHMERYMRQQFYMSNEWKQVRNKVVTRDRGCDLGLPGYEIGGPIYVHHMVPIDSVILRDPDKLQFALDPEYMITVSRQTHDAIHYGNENMLPKPIVERYPNDQAPWKIKMES